MHPFENIPNPTGKGAPTWGVSSLAIDSRGERVAALQNGLGHIFDAASGKSTMTWREPGTANHAHFLPDGSLLVVGQALHRVLQDGTIVKIGKKVFPGEDGPMRAVLSSEHVIAAHLWQDSKGDKGASFCVSVADGAVKWKSSDAYAHLLETPTGLQALLDDQRVSLDATTGATTPIGVLPFVTYAALSHQGKLWLADEGSRLVRLDHDGRIGASVDWPHGAIFDMVRVGTRLVLSSMESKPSPTVGTLDYWSLHSLDAETLGDLRRLPFREACASLSWSELDRVQALLAVGHTLWVGTGSGLLRIALE